MPKYISITQARTARFHSAETDSLITGLYTDNFSECNIFIFKKTYLDHIRISMTHADRLMSSEFVEQEIEWVGEDCEKLILRKNNCDLATMITKSILKRLPKALVSQFEIQELDSICFGIGIDCENLQQFSKDEIPDLACHPQEWIFHHHYTLNSLIDTQYISKNPFNSLIFDGKNWGEIDASQLKKSPHTELFYQDYLLQLSKFKDKCHTISRLIIKSIIQKYDFQLGNDISVAMIAFSTEVVHNANRFEEIFQKEVLFHKKYLEESNPNAELRKLINEICKLMSVNFTQTLHFINQHKLELRENPALRSIIGIASLSYRLQQHAKTFIPSKHQGPEVIDFEEEEKSPSP